MDAAEEELALAQRRCAELKVKLALKRKKPERPSGSTAAVGAAKEGIDVVEEGRRTGVGSGMAEKSKGRRPAKPSEKVRLNLADAKAVKEARVKKTAKIHTTSNNVCATQQSGVLEEITTHTCLRSEIYF
jgi:hypothetical protein